MCQVKKMAQKNLIAIKPKKLNMGDALLIAVSKTFTERLMARSFGLNQTVGSGAIKMGLGFALDKIVGGSIGDVLGTAMTVDGVEDFINGAMTGGLVSGLNISGSAGRKVM